MHNLAHIYHSLYGTAAAAAPAEHVAKAFQQLESKTFQSHIEELIIEPEKLDQAIADKAKENQAMNQFYRRRFENLANKRNSI